MTKNWKKIAEASGLAFTDEHLAAFAPALDALEAAFRPLLSTIPFETEPAIILSESALAPGMDDPE